MKKTIGTITSMNESINQTYFDAFVKGSLDLRAGQAAGHPAEVGLRPGRNDDGRGRAAFHARAEKTDVGVFDGRDKRMAGEPSGHLCLGEQDGRRKCEHRRGQGGVLSKSVAQRLGRI